MTSAYSRSASEPRERRSYPRDRGSGGTSFWNPNVPRNIDADSWRRDPAADHQAPRGTSSTRPQGERDRSRGRLERPPSRGSGGELRSRDYPNGGSRYSGGYRGRGRGRGGRGGDGGTGEMNGRGQGASYRGYPRYGGPPSGQGTQFFSPLTAPPIDSGRFNAAEALDFFAKRWHLISNEMNDKSLPQDQKPTVYKADATSGSVWDQSKVHVQAALTDFVTELKAAIERDQKSQTENETEPSQPSEP